MADRTLTWAQAAWDDYLAWQQQDRKTLRKINALIRDTMRHPFEGTGAPEPLRGNLTGLWSRRIDKANRLVYQVRQDTIIIFACMGHYS